MRSKKLILFVFFFVPLIFPEIVFSMSFSGENKTTTEWQLSNFVSTKTLSVQILGSPQVISCKYGNALHFNGIDDGIFLDQMPLTGLSQFTIEVLFYPESGGNFEQRFFHCGEVRGDRVLLELRSTSKDWYFDAFINSGEQKKTLIDSTRLHPLDQWYNVAYVVDHGKLTTYINGKKELEGQIALTPLETGKTSLGVRQNRQSWFKGMIYKIRITPKALNANEFMSN